MPQTSVYFYQEDEGEVPVREWLVDLQQRNRPAFAKCVQAIERLAEFGFELRRPHADMLRDGIYELRTRDKHVNYRILYFFHGRNIAVLGHALTKETKVPKADIERALERKQKLESNPEKHTFLGDEDG